MMRAYIDKVQCKSFPVTVAEELGKKILPLLKNKDEVKDNTLDDIYSEAFGKGVNSEDFISQLSYDPALQQYALTRIRYNRETTEQLFKQSSGSENPPKSDRAVLKALYFYLEEYAEDPTWSLRKTNLTLKDRFLLRKQKILNVEDFDAVDSIEALNLDGFSKSSIKIIQGLITQAKKELELINAKAPKNPHLIQNRGLVKSLNEKISKAIKEDNQFECSQDEFLSLVQNFQGNRALKHAFYSILPKELKNIFLYRKFLVTKNIDDINEEPQLASLTIAAVTFLTEVNQQRAQLGFQETPKDRILPADKKFLLVAFSVAERTSTVGSLGDSIGKIGLGLLLFNKLSPQGQERFDGIFTFKFTDTSLEEILKQNSINAGRDLTRELQKIIEEN